MAADAFERALAAGRAEWGAEWLPATVSRAPGRLELLGNHIDYNGGPVLAAAIDRDAVCLVSETPGPEIEILMADFEARAVVDPGDLRDWRSPGGAINPLDYVRGAIATGWARDGVVAGGRRIVVAGDVPIGFGLSSSAALCVALSLALHAHATDGRELVLRAQEAEHRAGTPCGTMDQSASVGGRVILYDGATVTWKTVNPALEDYVFAVADSGVHRLLGASAYPTRVQESQEALRRINALLSTSYESLAAIPAEALSMIEERLDPTLFRRVRHVVGETSRVHAGVAAMDAGDWERFGVLMTESGRSSAGDYAISHPRVEQIVSIALETPGVAGARMMGGGEGGTALILARREAIAGLTDALNAAYYRTYPTTQPDPVRVFQSAPGASLGRFEAQ